NIGDVALGALRDVDAAERWYLRSLELCADRDVFNRARIEHKLGRTAHDRFRGRLGSESEEELREAVDRAVTYYSTALASFPDEAYSHRGRVASDLASLFGELGLADPAIQATQEAV